MYVVEYEEVAYLVKCKNRGDEVISLLHWDSFIGHCFKYVGLGYHGEMPTNTNNWGM